MRAQGLTPILNVSDLEQSFEWFLNLGWTRLWDWGSPPTFGGVGSGPCEIFLCQGAQGGRGKSDLPVTTGAEGAEEGDKGVWMSLWVDDVDQVHEECVARGIEVTHPPTDEPWNVREMHIRHPDGHVFRVGCGIDRPGVDVTPLKIERVDVPVRLERRLATLLNDLAEHKGMTVGACLEETLLHTFEQTSGGVANPHTQATHDLIGELKARHGIDYRVHDSVRFVEAR
ncbi:MAG: bleomycin resistance family protein [Longimicrobiales bacterium]